MGRQKSRRQKLKDPTKGGRQAVSSIFQVSNAAVTDCHCVVWPTKIASASANARNEREIRMALHIALSGIIIIPLVWLTIWQSAVSAQQWKITCNFVYQFVKIIKNMHTLNILAKSFVRGPRWIRPRCPLSATMWQRHQSHHPHHFFCTTTIIIIIIIGCGVWVWGLVTFGRQKSAANCLCNCLNNLHFLSGPQGLNGFVVDLVSLRCFGQTRNGSEIMAYRAESAAYQMKIKTNLNAL